MKLWFQSTSQQTDCKIQNSGLSQSLSHWHQQNWGNDVGLSFSIAMCYWIEVSQSLQVDHGKQMPGPGDIQSSGQSWNGGRALNVSESHLHSMNEWCPGLQKDWLVLLIGTSLNIRPNALSVSREIADHITHNPETESFCSTLKNLMSDGFTSWILFSPSCCNRSSLLIKSSLWSAHTPSAR